MPPLIRPSRRDDGLLSLARLLAPYLVEVLGVGALPGVSEIDLAQSPAGKRRAHLAARQGEIEGAKKVQRRWYATRVAHDEWLGSVTTRPTCGASRKTRELAPEPTPLDDLRSRLGLRRVG